MEGLPMDLSPKDFSRTKSSSAATKGSNQLLPFICSLESYKTKFKNLHWAAANDNIHLRVDSFLDALNDYQDEVSECSQGIYGQLGPNDVTTTHLTFTDPEDAVKALEKEVISIRNKYKQDDDFIGIINSTEGFLTVIKKFIYLIRIAKK